MRSLIAFVALIGFAGLAWLAVQEGGLRSSFGPADDGASSVDALAAAWRGVAQAPKDVGAWLKLAEVQQALDELSMAERSLRTALELGDPSGQTQGALGFLLYGQGRDAEALALLQDASARGAELPMLRSTLLRLRETTLPRPVTPEPWAEPGPNDSESDSEGVGDAGVSFRLAPDAATYGYPEPAPEPKAPDGPPPTSPPPPADPGLCEIPLEPIGGGRSFGLTVNVAGLGAELIVDTGASLTVITRGLARDLGLALDRRRFVRAMTANGRVDMPTAVLPYVDVGGYAVENLRVAVCSGCVEDVADGLLGLDIQTLLQMRIDPAAGVAELGACWR